jgi:hypothetical protein
LLAALLAVLPVSAHAQCKKWDVSGVWEIRQSGLKYGIIVDLRQNGRVLIGSANISTNLHYGPVKADGTIDGDNVSLQIFWQDGTVGVYNAKFLPSGRLDGNGYEKKTPNITHIWQSSKQFKCPPPPSFNVPLNTYKGKPKPKPKPKPVSSTTKPKTEDPPPPPMKIPGIIASQVIYSNTYASTGFVVLTWDAGPDHPYAEVWFKVNGGPEARMVEQGKGVRQIMVERGKSYTYILTDAGKVLATVSFAAY